MKRRWVSNSTYNNSRTAGSRSLSLPRISELLLRRLKNSSKKYYEQILMCMKPVEDGLKKGETAGTARYYYNN